MKTTISVIKADVGGYVGHTSMHPALMETAEASLERARSAGEVTDYSVLRVGDDIALVCTHTGGPDYEPVHKLAWDIFLECTEKAKELGLYGAGQDLLADSFSGNIKGQGPGAAEMELDERPSEPLLVFLADKTSPGAWNLPLFEVFGNPMSTTGLVIDPKLCDGFRYEVLDMRTGATITLACPAEMHELLALIGSTSRYVIKNVWRPDGIVAASASTQKLHHIAGKYVGKDDPALVMRAQSGFPSVGECLDPFARPHIVDGWLRGSHNGPLMPCAFHQANPVRMDGPPRVVCAGFQLKDGKLVGPRDMFDDPSFDKARDDAKRLTDYLRRQGPFEPHRLPEKDMEYTTLPAVLEKLKERFTLDGRPATADQLAGKGTR